MAVGEVIGGTAALVQYGTLDIRPTGTEEWIVHNIYFSDEIEVYYYNGTNLIKFEWQNQGHLPWLCLHATSARYFRLRAIEPGTTTYVGYDGVVSRI